MTGSMGSATTVPDASMTRREAVSRMAIALALACVGIPLIGPALARWAAAQERKRLILAQLQKQAQMSAAYHCRQMAEQLNGGYPAEAFLDQHGRLWCATIHGPLVVNRIGEFSA